MIDVYYLLCSNDFLIFSVASILLMSGLKFEACKFTPSQSLLFSMKYEVHFKQIDVRTYQIC